jgi:cation diffusion facilitator family transporter
MNQHAHLKSNAARLSVISNSCLIILKLIAGILSGSVSILSEAIHSGLDLVAAIIAWFSVRLSAQPPDKNHPYGHGKFENVSGVIEALLIVVAAIWIVYEAIHKLHTPSDELLHLEIGVGVMLISSIVNYFVSRHLYKIAHLTDSIALEADALHLKTDVLTSMGVAVGLLLIKLTGFLILDPLIAIFVALLILKESYVLLNKAFHPLTDAGLSMEEVNFIQSIIGKYLDGPIDFHHLRTRKAGSIRYVEFHLEVPGHWTVTESHRLCDMMEGEIEAKLPGTEVSIHVEPLKPEENIL